MRGNGERKGKELVVSGKTGEIPSLVAAAMRWDVVKGIWKGDGVMMMMIPA